jgi:hypothetical protein
MIRNFIRLVVKATLLLFLSECDLVLNLSFYSTLYLLILISHNMLVLVCDYTTLLSRLTERELACHVIE